MDIRHVDGIIDNHLEWIKVIYNFLTVAKMERGTLIAIILILLLDQGKNSFEASYKDLAAVKDYTFFVEENNLEEKFKITIKYPEEKEESSA